MKYRVLSSLLLTAGLAALPGFAQSPPAHAPANGNGMANMEQRWFDRAASELSLTESQKTEAHKILDAARQETQPLQHQIMQQRRAMFDAIKADRTADLDRLSREHGELLGKMMGIQTRAFARIYAILTPEQKTKADQLFRHFMQSMHGGVAMHAPHPQS